MKHVILLLAMATLALPVMSQQHTMRYYGEADGLTHSHLTQMLQDPEGFIWISTWNGLNRFDGYEFRCFKTHPGDGCNMPTNRLRNIMAASDGNLWCQAEDSIVLFSMTTGRFSSVAPAEADSVLRVMKRKSATRSVRTPIALGGDTLTDAKRQFQDRQGNLWVLGARGTYEIVTHKVPGVLIDTHGQAVKCIADSLLATDDKKLQVLRPDGTLHTMWEGAATYCMTCDPRDGTTWLGTKPNGIYHLTAAGATNYATHNSALTSDNVYDLKFDSRGRLWIATLGGGLCCLMPDGRMATSCSGLSGYPADVLKARHLTLTADTLIVSTTSGLLIADISAPHTDSIRFVRHRRDPLRQGSLSCNATMMTMVDTEGRLVVCTESGGVNVTRSALRASQLEFEHHDRTTGMATDIALSAFADTEQPHVLWVVSSDKLVRLDLKTGQSTYFGPKYWMRNCQFAEAKPARQADGQWLLGLTDGALKVDLEELKLDTFCPNIVITSIATKGQERNYLANSMQRIELTPSERDLSISFAAIDLRDMSSVRYAYRLKADDPWTYADGHTATFIDLDPGEYVLEIRSTNADGVWVDNTRQVSIVAHPRFSETTAFSVLMILGTIAVACVVMHTIVYIARIRREHRETLTAYLALMDDNNRKVQAVADERRKAQKMQEQAADDAMMRKVMAFINDNISNPDIKIEDIAQAGATSKSVLTRKTKEFFGLTPADLLREARMQKACAMLADATNTVADVATGCGFADTKYFAKCFKASVGQTPTQYRGTIVESAD